MKSAEVQITGEAVELFSKISEEKQNRILVYMRLLVIMNESSNPEAERINSEYQAEIESKTLTDEKELAYLAALAAALEVL